MTDEHLPDPDVGVRPVDPHADAPPDPARVVIEQRLHPASPLVRFWVGLVAIGWALFTQVIQGQNPLDGITSIPDLIDLLGRAPWWLLGMLGVLLIGLGFTYWSWWTTRFVIDDRELRIENRGAFQESKRIAFSRIQGVDVSQPFAARLLGLAELSIDVGADAATKLSFLNRARASELRDYLMARAHGRSASTAEAGPAASAWDDLSARDEVLIRLTPGDILLSAVFSTQLALLLLGMLVPLALATWFDLAWVAIGGGLLPLAVALVGFLSNRVIGQFNYTLARTPAGLRITRGLLTLRSQTIPAHRVQAIQISQPVAWRYLNRARLDLTMLGISSDDESAGLSATVYLPIGTPAQVRLALAALWPGLRLDDLRFRPCPPRAKQLDPLAHGWIGHALDEHIIAARSGWLTRRQLILPHARLQSVTLTQGPLERRLNLANVQLHTSKPFGFDAVQHLDADEARWFAFSQLDRARASRAEELLHPPGLGPVPADAGAPPGSGDDVWTPETASLRVSTNGTEPGTPG